MLWAIGHLGNGLKSEQLNFSTFVFPTYVAKRGHMTKLGEMY